MPPCDVTFEFAPGQRVKIPDISQMAVVNQACVMLNGNHDYQVCYWFNGEWKTVWLPPSQLQEIGDAQ